MCEGGVTLSNSTPCSNLPTILPPLDVPFLVPGAGRRPPRLWSAERRLGPASPATAPGWGWKPPRTIQRVGVEPPGRAAGCGCAPRCAGRRTGSGACGSGGTALRRRGCWGRRSTWEFLASHPASQTAVWAWTDRDGDGRGEGVGEILFEPGIPDIHTMRCLVLGLRRGLLLLV